MMAFIKRQFDIDWLMWASFFVMAFLVSPPMYAAEPQVVTPVPTPNYTLWSTTYCYSWGDPIGYRWIQCETPIRQTQPTVVERIIERPIPAPVPQSAPPPPPAKKIRG